eukprot:3445025-Rhodomonas_salina.1
MQIDGKGRVPFCAQPTNESEQTDTVSGQTYAWCAHSVVLTRRAALYQTGHSPERDYNGMAPQAKLVFDDIFKDDTLAPPDDLEADLYPEPYTIGARIRSESWSDSAAPRNPTQETAFPGRIVPGMRFLVLEFAV